MILKRPIYIIELDFFPRCPLPYSLPSGSSTNLTARRFTPSLDIKISILVSFISNRTIKILLRNILVQKIYLIWYYKLYRHISKIYPQILRPKKALVKNNGYNKIKIKKTAQRAWTPGRFFYC